MEQQDDAGLKHIVREGLKSDFWKFLQTSCEGLRDGALAEMKRPIKSFDDLIKLAHASSTYRNAELYLNWPSITLTSIEHQEKLDAQSKMKVTIDQEQGDN